VFGPEKGNAHIFADGVDQGEVRPEKSVMKVSVNKLTNELMVKPEIGTSIYRIITNQYQKTYLPNIPYVIFWVMASAGAALVIHWRVWERWSGNSTYLMWLLVTACALKINYVSAILTRWVSFRGLMVHVYILAYFGFLGVVLVKIFTWLLSKKADKLTISVWKSRIGMLILIGLLMLGLSNRWVALERVVNQPLEPDVGYYVLLAKTITGPYNTGVREPLFVWWTKLMVFLGNEMVTVRLGSMLWSLGIIAASYALFKKAVGWVNNLLVAFFLSVHPFLIEMSARGLREDMYTTFILLCTYFLVFKKYPKTGPGWVETLGLSLISAILLLIRFMALPYLGLIMIFFIFKYRIRFKKIILMVAIPFLMFFPYLRFNQITYGKATYFSDFQAIYQRNYEFVRVRQIGCDGCPTMSELIRNGYAGRPITTFDYFFKLHSLSEVVKRTITGTLSIWGLDQQLFGVLIGNNFGMGIIALYVLGFMGSVVKKSWTMFILPILMLNTILFLIPMGIDIRVAMHIIPFLFVLVAEGASILVKTAYGLLYKLMDKKLQLFD